MRVPLFITQIDDDIQLREHVFCGKKGIYDIVTVVTHIGGKQIDL